MPSHDASRQLFDRALRRIPGGVNSPVRAFRAVGGTPFFTSRAHGCRLETADGRSLIDLVCTWGPSIHGHDHPALRAALHAAVDRGTSFGTPHAGEVEMAETLAACVPSLEKVRLCNSGTEATMSAIRLARGFTGRSRIIKFAGCYHGHVDSLLIRAGSGALTHGHPDSAGIPPSLAAETLVLPFNDAATLQAAFDHHGNDIAAVILEPYPANIGLILPAARYLHLLRSLTTAAGALLIFDEVMTGFRLGLDGVQGLEAIRPDLTCLGKIIGGGLPVGAFGGRGDVMDHLAPLGPVYQAGTLSGNPLAVAAGLASIRLLTGDPPFARLHAAGQRIRDALLSAAATRGIPVQVPQVGSMFAVFFTDAPVTDASSALRSDAAAFARFFRAALDRGIYLPPSAYETCFLSTAHAGPDLDATCDGLAAAMLAL